ncbi:MAG TPA: PDGLE domain-containing protein, partial [Actinotalea sp.]|nr:PDGLE domain-containing protein [Actinotalea sp.]
LAARLALRLVRARRGVVPAAALGALLSVPAAALAFTALYAIGGAVAIPLPRLAGAMLAWHAVIGVGEALITAAVLGAVVATRPDLVHLTRHVRVREAADGPPVRVVAGPRTLAVASAVTLAVAGGLSLLASGHPDGLEYVGESAGFADAARDSALAASPLADYAVAGLAVPWLSGSLAGVVGVLVTVGLGLTVAALVVGVRTRRATDAAPQTTG